MGGDEGRRAVEVVVRGRVQGVFFRASTVEQATQRGVRGWVRNEPDGAVRAHLEGDHAAVTGLLAWIEDGGPAGARVEHVAVETVAPTDADGFVVRR